MAPCDNCARNEKFCWNVRELFCQKHDTWNGPKNVRIVTLPNILRIFLKEMIKFSCNKRKTLIRCKKISFLSHCTFFCWLRVLNFKNLKENPVQVDRALLTKNRLEKTIAIVIVTQSEADEKSPARFYLTWSNYQQRHCNVVVCIVEVSCFQPSRFNGQMVLSWALKAFCCGAKSLCEALNLNKLFSNDAAAQTPVHNWLTTLSVRFVHYIATWNHHRKRR